MVQLGDLVPERPAWLALPVHPDAEGDEARDQVSRNVVGMNVDPQRGPPYLTTD